MRKLPRDVRFFAASQGDEPAREWLKSFSKEERKIIGEDLKTAQGTAQWRKPLVDYLGDGLWEVRSTLPHVIVRILFAEIGGEMIVLHGFKKKTQKTPADDLLLARKRKKIYENAQK